MRGLDASKLQVPLYLAAMAAGWIAGIARPEASGAFEAALWPALAALLFATFLHVPLWRLKEASRDGRFLLAVLVGNFVVVPVLLRLTQAVWPSDPALRLGVALVLLAPCTDWFLTFNLLGKGDPARAVAVTPALLLLQLALLPALLAAVLGGGYPNPVSLAEAWPAAATVLTPLGLALAVERLAAREPRAAKFAKACQRLPIPLLAAVVFLIAASQAERVRSSFPELSALIPVYCGYLVGSVLLAMVLTRAFRLPGPQGRTLAFSLGTRNSFVVLPFALALPAQWVSASLAVVLQALVELAGMALLVRALPRILR